VGGDLLTFDEALAELQMATHELRSLVAQGEIRAFRDDDILKFRRTDILDLKKSRETQAAGLMIKPGDIGDEELAVPKPQAAGPAPGPEVKPAKHETEETELLPGVAKETSTDFLGLDETATGGEPGGDTAQTVVPTIEIADEEATIDDTARTVVPSLSADEDTNVLGEAPTVIPPPAPSLLAEEDEATEMATQEISPEDVAPTAPVATERAKPLGGEHLRFQDEEIATAEGEELGITTDDIQGAGATAGVTAPRRSQQYLAETAAPPVSPLFLALAIATFIILLLAVPIFYGLATDTAPQFGPYKALLELLSQNTMR
jgi:hypothetical protein